MPTKRTVFRIVTGTTCVAAAVGLYFAYGSALESARDELRSVREQRSVEITKQVIPFLQSDDEATFIRFLDILMERDPEILSIGVRRANGELFASTPTHVVEWLGSSPDKSTLSHVRVPIQNGRELWGSVEIAYRSLASVVGLSWFLRPEAVALLLLTVISDVLFLASLFGTGRSRDR